MFDALKQLAQLRDVQKIAAQQTAVVERDGIRVVVGGDLTIRELILDPSRSAPEQQDQVRAIIGEAFKNAQSAAAQAMMGTIRGLP